MDVARREWRQFTNEVHQVPRSRLAFFRTRRPCRHPCQPNAVLDDVEQLAVRERLRGLQTHIGWLRIEANSEFGLAAAIVRVTGRAVVGVMRHPLSENFWRLRNRVLEIVP